MFLKKGFQITTHPEALKVPYTWKKPQLVFVNAMSDLFHPEVLLDLIKEVFEVMQDKPKHRFIFKKWAIGKPPP